MDWIERLNSSLGYVEENLEGTIAYDQIGRIACCSPYQFQRMFAYMTGISLSEYVRRRRMTLAAFDLQTTDIKVIEVALKYGYESPTSFTRAFQGIHGITPREAKIKGTPLKSYHPISFQISIRGDEAMEYRIEKKEAMRIVGAKKRVKMDMEAIGKEIPPFWDEVGGDGRLQTLISFIGKAPQGILGVNVDVGDHLDYYIGVVSDEEATQGMEVYQAPPCTYAIFSGQGLMPEAMQNLQKQIMTEWLPNSQYEFGGGPDIEVYYNENPKDPQGRFEVWFPIKQK